MTRRPGPRRWPDPRWQAVTGTRSARPPVRHTPPKCRRRGPPRGAPAPARAPSPTSSGPRSTSSTRAAARLAGAAARCSPSCCPVRCRDAAAAATVVSGVFLRPAGTRARAAQAPGLAGCRRAAGRRRVVLHVVVRAARSGWPRLGLLLAAAALPGRVLRAGDPYTRWRALRCVRRAAGRSRCWSSACSRTGSARHDRRRLRRLLADAGRTCSSASSAYRRAR